MAYTASQAVQHYQQRQQQAREAIGWYDKLKARVREVGRRTRAELDAAALELAGAYLPELSPPLLERVERLTGYVGFKRRDPLKAMEHERQVLSNTVKRIEADERYQKREILAGPEGTLSSKLAEAREMIEPFRSECAKFEELEGFTELVRVKYDTPEFEGKWWQGDYWRHWKLGDAICEALGMDDFGDDVLPAYQKVAKERDYWRREITALEAELGEIHGLVKQHDDACARVRNLKAIYLEQCQQVLAKHLAEADVALLDEWLGKESVDDRGVRMNLRRLSGLRAKFEVMRELHDHGIEPVVHDLHARMQKYARKAAKFNRPKYWNRPIGERDLDLKFDEKARKLHERSAKLAALVDRIAAYDDYGRFDLDNDPDLWWHAFTGGKRPPRMLPRLRRYYERHPEAQPSYDDSLLTAQAVAEAAREAAQAREDLGYLS